MILNDEQLAAIHTELVDWSLGDLLDTIADLKRQLAEREAAFRDVAPTVEFYLKREIESPSNHQEFAREAEEKLNRFREATTGAALDAYVQEKVAEAVLAESEACSEVANSMLDGEGREAWIQGIRDVKKYLDKRVAANRRAAQHPSGEAPKEHP